MNKLLKICLSALFFVSLVSCGSYQISTVPKVKITKILTVTSTGDTLAVPLKDFQRYHFNNYDFSRFNFYGGYHWNSWQYPYNYWGGIYRPNSWYYRDWYYSPPIYNSPLLRPQVQQTPIQRVYVNGRRGSNGQVNNNNDNIINRYIDKLRNKNIDVNIIENNDQINRSDTRIYLRPESGSNGRRSWSGENNFTPPVKPRLITPGQPRQIRGGQNSQSVQQSQSGGSSSGQGGGRVIIKQD